MSPPESNPDPGVRNPSADYGRLPTEREVLRALWGARKELVRSEIHRRMPYEHRPTLGRVGQILAALHKDQLLLRLEGKAQGSRKAGFYTLSDYGRVLCRDLGFEREEQPLFSASEEMLRTHLTPERLSWRPTSPGRTIAAYSVRGGLGRTTMVAHLARGLAEELPADQRLLVIDLDLEAPGLDAFFPSERLKRCRGLAGLIVDFERRPPLKRALWLRGALNSPEYVLIGPLPEVPGLVYLPTGLGQSQQALSPSERAEALAVLRAEAGLTSVPGRDNSGLLSELREALPEKFAASVVDPEPGYGLGAWIATQALADDLIVYTQVADEAPASLSGLRTVLANFLHKHKDRDSGGVRFVFRTTELGAGENHKGWIDKNLVMSGTWAAAFSTTYQVQQLPYEARFVDQNVLWSTDLFRHLVSGLKGLTSIGEATISANTTLRLLLDVLDPEKDSHERSIAAGALKHCPLQELARWVDWYVREGPLHKITDSKGEELIQGIVKAHSDRLLSKILQP